MARMDGHSPQAGAGLAGPLAGAVRGRPIIVGLPAHLAADPAFRAARRHSRRVRFLRRAVPLGAVFVLIALVAKSFVGFFSNLDVGIASIAIDGHRIVMEKPRLSGFKRDGRSYELTAATAIQDVNAPNAVDLDALSARMQTGNDGWANLTGARGRYDSKIERLEVTGGVNVRTDSGLDATLQDAEIEFKAGTIITQKPVDVKMPQGAVEAQSMQVQDNGKRLVFEGQVRSVFVNAHARGAPDDDKPAPPAAAAN